MNTQAFDQEAVEAQARQWSIALSSGEADKAMLDAFNAWRTADPRHEEIFQSVDKVWRNMSRLEHMRRYAKLPEKSPGFFERLSSAMTQWLQPSTAMMASACALVMAVGVFFMLPKTDEMAPQVASVEYQSAKGEVKTVTLDDGSKVTLGADSHLIVSLSASKREAKLESGSALFSVESNPERPFTVMTGRTETRVLGTVFAVERKPYGVRVAVQEGRVRVGEAVDDASIEAAKSLGDNVLIAGQAVTASLTAVVSEKFPVDVSTVGSWEQGRLVYKNASLKEIIADANRYYDGKIMLADAKTGEQQVSIAFEVTKIDGMLENIAEVVGLDVNRDVPGRVILKLMEE